MQEISKIVGDMWQKALPEQKAPYIEQVTLCQCYRISLAVYHYHVLHATLPVTQHFQILKL